MGWVPVAISAGSAVLFWGTGHPILLTLSIIAIVGCLWSWGIMHNYAIQAASRRSGFSGGFSDITDREADSVPNWIAYINMGFALLGVALLIAAIVMRFFF